MLVVVNLVATQCYVQAISDLLRQLVTSPMKLSTLLQDAEYQLVADLSNNWGQAVRTHPDIDLISTDLLQLAYLHSINQV